MTDENLVIIYYCINAVYTVFTVVQWRVKSVIVKRASKVRLFSFPSPCPLRHLTNFFMFPHICHLRGRRECSMCCGTCGVRGEGLHV